MFMDLPENLKALFSDDILVSGLIKDDNVVFKPVSRKPPGSIDATDDDINPLFSDSYKLPGFVEILKTFSSF